MSNWAFWGEHMSVWQAYGAETLPPHACCTPCRWTGPKRRTMDEARQDAIGHWEKLHKRRSG